VLKSPVMNSEPSGIAAALARAWRAVVRAFTPTRDSARSQADGMDTTMFGGLPEQPGAGRGQDAGKENFWDAAGESTDFADPDPDRRHGRR
jgi:hypothetical protein